MRGKSDVAAHEVQGLTPALTAPVPYPRPEGTTNAAVADFVLALSQALHDANAKLEAIGKLGQLGVTEKQ